MAGVNIKWGGVVAAGFLAGFVMAGLVPSALAQANNCPPPVDPTPTNTAGTYVAEYGNFNVLTAADLQTQINTAASNGVASVTIPSRTVVLITTRGVNIPCGAKNFTLRGGTDTVFARASATAGQGDFPLLSVCGQSGARGLYLSSFTSLPSFPVQPAARGDTRVELIGNTNVTEGWYALLATNPIADVVRHPNSNTGTAASLTFGSRITPVYVNNVASEGSRRYAYLDNALARDYPTAGANFLYQLGDSGSNSVPFADRRFGKNITVENITFDGRGGGVIDQDYGPLTNKVIIAESTDNTTFNNIIVRGYYNVGLGGYFSRNFNVNGISFPGPARHRDLGYGLELAGTNISNINNLRAYAGRYGVLHQGTSNSVVTDAIAYSADPGSAFFNAVAAQNRATGILDVGHGNNDTGNRIENSGGAVLNIANPAWQRGSNFTSVVNSSFDKIQLYGGADNVTISGKLANKDFTAKQLVVQVDSYRAPVDVNGPVPASGAIPGGIIYPKRVTLNNCVLDAKNEGSSVSYFSGSNQGPAFTRLEFNNCLIKNRNGTPIAMNGVQTANSAFVFNNSIIQTSWTQGLLNVGTIAGGSLNVTLNNTQFNAVTYATSPSRIAMIANSNAAVNVRVQGNTTVNSQPFAASNFQNFGTGTITFE